jgi:hypothetical protein
LLEHDPLPVLRRLGSDRAQRKAAFGGGVTVEAVLHAERITGIAAISPPRDGERGST